LLQKFFLRRSFSAEGSVSYDINTKRWEIKYSMYKLLTLERNARKYLECLRKLLENFNINSKIYTKQRYKRKSDNKKIIGFHVMIRGNQNIKRFKEHMGFDIKYKNQNLLRAIGPGAAAESRC